MEPQGNIYILNLPGEAPIRLDLYDDDLSRYGVYLDYYIGAFRQMEKRLGPRGLTFYIQWYSHLLDTLPSGGSDVVALLLIDEYNRLPSYFGRIKLALMPFGEHPPLPALPVDYVGVLSCAKFLRHVSVWFPTWLRYRLRRLLPATRRQYRQQAVEAVPLGYGNQAPVALKPFQERKFFLSFAGSVFMYANVPAIRKVIRSPKDVARSRMLDAVERFREQHPDIPIHIRLVPGYDESVRSDPLEYASLLNDTKICLVPRGSTPETTRFFEALRAGCVVVCERLPDKPLYRDSPAIQLKDWSKLETTLQRLLDDPGRLDALQRQSLDWWRTRCSEEVLGNRLAERLLSM